MTDFCQNGVITTLQKLKGRPLEEIDQELKAISRKRKMVLLLPALVTEFDGKAMPRIIEEEDYRIIREIAQTKKNGQFFMPIETWVRIVYRYAGAFRATPRQRFKVLDTLTPLYYGRVASLVNELQGKTPEEAEEHFEHNALAFERMKEYMVAIWGKKGAEP